ncbi:hypothetical protein Q4543_22010 [Salipiger sp. 1_MG-2023]|uniref:hypothetical protein n=1 Tax=Salipiger sp. 1_MG-2023 TaxID=3062665 RepID=UPI0026E395E9|nr:hypothetical protein [Salipiger sp. 1_MG-2023]MDO6588177.1 hypothetical protein [Salipiger sp. 1_MG-2023]
MAQQRKAARAHRMARHAEQFVAHVLRQRNPELTMALQGHGAVALSLIAKAIPGPSSPARRAQ